MLRSWFDKKQQNTLVQFVPGLTGPRVPRHSGAWGVIRKRLEAEPGLRVIDVGYTSPNNINFLTNLGHSVFLADLEVDAFGENWITGTDEDEKPIWNFAGYLEHTLNFAGRMFDLVLLWSALDYLPEPLVAPVVAHLYESMNPGGQVLAFFHTKMQGDEAVRCRFHLTATDDVEMQLTQQFPIQRCFTNRSIERLFAGWSGHRQFLAKDSVSEVIMTR
ncbi:MAG TPA: class I SAM-dependent methyltransferase [Terracidiphilus sp.]|nr:class I SAM-dependent methyltransferase [Terracidiphilus sp.]